MARRVERDAMRERRTHVLDPEHVDDELAELVDRSVDLVPQHARARRGRAHDVLGSLEHPREPPRQRRPLPRVTRVHVHLPAAGLLEREVHLASEPLQQPHHRPSGLREQGVVEAGDEEGDAHAGYRFLFLRAVTGANEDATSRDRSAPVYQQDFNPVSDSLGLTAIFAALPLICLFVLLGGFKLKAQWAARIALGMSMLVALIVYSMPVGQTALSASEGAAFGIFPIMWIVVTAIWVYNMTVASGHFAVLRRSFGAISNDQRIQAVIVAFCFGALMEALAGFGTPVAISAVMLIALGFKPIKAASVALVANTAPVAFGAIAVPITTLSGLTEIPKEDLGAMVGRQTPFLALIVPLILVGMVDGWRGVRSVWPAAIAGGFTFALAQFVCSNFISVELTDIVASLAA